MRNLSKIDLKRVFIALVALLVVLPFLTFAGHSKKIYVDTNASSNQDGSSAHPYKTIGQALRRANKDNEIHVANGTYRENIEVNGVDIYGQDSDKTIIEAKDDSKATVRITGSAKLDGLKIRDGRNGVKITDGGRVKIINCIITKNDSDGVLIESGSQNHSLDDSNQVMISGNVISNNGADGIHSEKRNVIVFATSIVGNENDGALFEAGAKVWIGSVEFKDNSGSGLVATLDGTSLFTKNISYSNNRHEGIEVNTFGGAGRIDINKSKIRNNGNYGIARIERKAANASVWNGLTVENTGYLLTHKGEVSPIFRIFN